jgi:hypothetical protein
MRKFLAPLVLLLLSGCSESTAPADQIASFGVARQRWASRHYTDYAFTFQQTCFCVNVHPIRATVERDTVRSAIDLITNQPVDPSLVMSINGLFTFIQNGLEQHADKLVASYDQVLGYPSTIEYDFRFSIADDEGSISVRDVTPTPIH